MRHSIRTLAGTAIVLAATACSDNSHPAPTSPATLDAREVQCQTNLLPDLLRQYFPAASRPRVRGLIAQLDSLVRQGNSAGATAKGFDILANVADVTDAGNQVGTPQDGSAFANAVLACMKVGGTGLPRDLSPALAGGAFAVRGGPSDLPGPVLSRDDFAGIGIVAPATWNSVLGQRVLLVGIPNPLATFNEVLIDSPYEWSTIPTLPKVGPGAIMGLCVENTGTLRLERVHGNTSHTILLLRDPSFFLACPNLPIVVAGAPGINSPGPVGGSATGFSDFGSVDAQAVNLTYQGQPSTVRAGAAITPAVKLIARGNGGTPLPEVTIAVSLVTISGTGSLSGATSKITGVGGIETFRDLRVSAPGTYALLTTATLAGFPPVQLQSATFTVTP